MNAHSIKLAVRHIAKQKLYAFLNVIGLALGLYFFLLIVLYVQDEMLYDRFNSKSERTYRMLSHLTHLDLETALTPYLW